MNSDPDYVLSDEVRDLIIRYMEACNAGEHAKAEVILQKIKDQGITDNESND